MLNKSFLLILVFALAPLGAFAGDYYGHQQNLTGLKAQTKILDRQIDRLIKERKTTTSDERKKAIIEEILLLQEELEVETEKYNHEITHMRFYHPEKGVPEALVYKRKKIKNLSPYALEEGIDAKLTEAVMNVEDKFGDQKKPVETMVKNRQPTSEKKMKKDEMSTLERIILKK